MPRCSGLDLSSVFPGDNPDAAPDTFSSVQGTYRIQNKGIDLANFVLDNSRGRLEAEGRIDFSHALNIRVRPSIFQAATAPASASPPSFLLGGTIESSEAGGSGCRPQVGGTFRCPVERSRTGFSLSPLIEFHPKPRTG